MQSEAPKYSGGERTGRWISSFEGRMMLPALVILAAISLLWAYQRVFHGLPEGENATFPEMTWREGAIMAPLLVLIVFLGVYPRPVLDRISPSVRDLVTHVEEHSDYRQPAIAAGLVDK